MVSVMTVLFLCRIRVTTRLVSWRHCRLFMEEQAFIFLSHSTSEYVCGKEISEIVVPEEEIDDPGIRDCIYKVFNLYIIPLVGIGNK